MVEIEEIKDDDATKEEKVKPNTSSGDTIEKDGKIYKKRIPKKDLPSVAHMLVHGSPESQGRPKTFCDIFGFPIFVAICFAISLLIFHYAPHDKSVQPRGKFSMAKNQRKQQQYKPIVPEPPPVDTQVPPVVPEPPIDADVPPPPPKVETVEDSTGKQAADEPREATTTASSEEL